MKKTNLTKVCFFLYAAVMLWLLFFQRIGYASSLSYRESLSVHVNLVPFFSIKNMLLLVFNRPELRFFALRNLLGNLLIFIPLGYFLPELFRRLTGFRSFFLCLSIILLSVEGLQLFTTLGNFDIDDLILNLIGGSSGFFFRRMGLFQGKKYKSSKNC